MSQLKVDSIVPRGGIPTGAEGGGIIQVVSDNIYGYFYEAPLRLALRCMILDFNAAITPSVILQVKFHVMVYMGA